MNRSSAALVSLLALSACGGDDHPNNPNTGGQGGSAGTGGVATSLGGCTSAECGPTVDSFFDNGKLATLKLTFDEEVLKSYTDAEHPDGYSQDQWLDLLWNKWNNHCGPYEWVPARMEYESPDHDGDVTLERVSVRLRGSRSRGANPLAGFKLDFTKSLPNGTTRRFAGLNRVNVLSNERDESNMVQCMGYKLMRDFGLPAPMCNHLQVYVNGKLYGLVESVERAKDARFLKNHFGTSDGAMYAASATCGFTDSLADLEYKGDVYENGKYPGIYEILRGTAVDAEANLIPMMKCGDATQTPDDEEFKACISDWIDLDQWLKVIAGESMIPSVEDFIGARRNFYLYFLPDPEAPHGGRFKVWGWDYDTVLQRSTCLPTSCDPFTSVANWYGPIGKRQKLIVRLTNVFKAQYCGHLNSFLTEVYDPAKVDAMASVIEPAMVADPVVTEDKWRAEVTRMRDYMTQHATDMAAVLEKVCADTP